MGGAGRSTSVGSLFTVRKYFFVPVRSSLESHGGVVVLCPGTKRNPGRQPVTKATQYCTAKTEQTKIVFN